MDPNRLAAGIWWMAMAVLLGSTQVAVAGTSWTINRFELAWQSESPDLPSLESLERTPFQLSRTANGFSMKATGMPGVRTDLTALNRQRGVHIDAAGLNAIASAIQAKLSALGFMGATVEPSLQQVRPGQSPSYNVWFIADFPLPGVDANATLPTDLVPLHQQHVAGEAVTGIHLQWQGESGSMPAPSDLLRSLTVPVAVRGGVVMASPRDSMPLRQLSDNHMLRWTPEAIDALSTAVGNAASQSASPGTATVDHTQRVTGMAGVTLNYTVDITMPLPPEKPVKTAVIAAPPAAVAEATKTPPPAAVVEATKTPPPAAVAEATKTPPPAAVAEATKTPPPAAVAEATKTPPPTAVAEATKTPPPAAVAEATKTPPPTAVAEATKTPPPTAVAEATKASPPAAVAEATKASPPVAVATTVLDPWNPTVVDADYGRTAYNAISHMLATARLPQGNHAADAFDSTRPVLYSTAVNLNDFDQTTNFGRLMSEALAIALTQHWENKVINITSLQGSVPVIPRQGEFLLSRNISELATDFNAGAVMLTTYTVALDKVYVHVELVNVHHNAVVAAVMFHIPLGPRTEALLRGKVSPPVAVAEETKVSPAAAVAEAPKVSPPVAVTEAPKASPPVAVTEAPKVSPPAAVAEATKAPHVEVSKVEQVDGIHIAWPPEHEAWGSADSLFTLTSVRLRLVDGAVQAGWGHTGDLLPVADLQRFPTRGWQPSATRAVRNALKGRLTEVGMSHTQLTEAIIDQEDGRFVVFTLHPPARPEYMPPLASKSEVVDGGVYYVSWPFEVMYAAPHTQLPAASSFEWISVALGHDEHGWTGSTEGSRTAITLAALNEAGPMLYDSDAIKAIGNAINNHLVAQDLMGVGVRPLQSQIPSTGPDAGADLRGDRTELTLVVTVGRVVEVRTIASGGRVDGEERVNHPTHQRIADQSPLQGSDGGDEGSLIRRKQLDEYLYFLSRHPGRDIEGSVTNQLVSQNIEPSIAGEGAPIAVELTEAEDGPPGGAYLTYRIAEEKPWSLWFQYGNTGTKSEGYQRYRAGFVHSQLTGNDDILSLQYVTSNGSDTNAVIGSYEAPLGLDGRLRWGINGSWSQYFADQFGAGRLNNYTGHSWAGGGDLRLNVYQDGPFFADIIGGARLQHLSASNDTAGFEIQEQASFIIPYGMIQFNQSGQWSNIRGSIGIEGNVTSHDNQQLTRLGFVTNRLTPANQWARMNLSASMSVYLEPLIDPAAWTDPSTPGSSTLAHELLVNFSGQYAFGSRLLPQFQSVSGGPGTNRGYPVSVAAGDNAINMTGEYRFHLPRAFALEAEPGRLFGEPFRVSPQHVYGRPDWDLVLLSFIDASWLTQNGDKFFRGRQVEFDETLLSAGVGFELAIKRNLQIRLDWGWALKSMKNGLYDAGHNRLYVQASLSF